MKAKIFIHHHPVTLIFYKNLAEKMRQCDKNVKIIMFKVNHKYFKDFDFGPYDKYFDRIVDFDFLSYKRNILAGLLAVFRFKRKLKKVISSLRDFGEIDLFFADSAWLPINILLYSLSKEKNVKKITRFSFADAQSAGTKPDRLKTLFCNFYSLFFGCYKVKAISTLAGKFINFEYSGRVPGTLIKIASPTAQLNGQLKKRGHIFPYPVIFRDSSQKEKDMVIVFGDTSVYQFYSEFLPGEKVFNERLGFFLKEIEKKYPNCQLYYKPHPCDEGKIAEGIDKKKYKLLDNSVDIQALFDRFGSRIKAVYAFCSVSTIFASFFAIPSYTFYHYFFNKTGIKKFDDLFGQDNIKSRFLFHISDLSQIGSIDNLARPGPSESSTLDDKFREVLNI